MSLRCGSFGRGRLARRVGPTALAALLLACTSDPEIVTDASVVFSGGSISPPGCSYEVRTAAGATAPLVVEGGTVGAAPEPYHIHLGFAADPATSMVVGWRARDDATTDAALLFGAADMDQSRPALTWQYEDLDGEVMRAFEAHLCGLRPDTEYSYQVRSGDVRSPVATFRTAPDRQLPLARATVVLVIGDSRGSSDVFGRLLAKADEIHAPDLLLFTGDAVQHGGVQAQWDSFLDQGQPIMTRIPTIMTVGNHEDGDQIFSTIWAMPGDEHWFSFDYGPMHIAVADDSPDLFPDITGAGEAFLRQDLPLVAARDWSIVMHHQPMVTAESIDGHGPALRLIERWMPIIDRYRVDLVLNGHNHRYERSLPMRGGEVASPGTTYLVTAGAGAPLYDAPLEEWTAATFSQHHFVILRVDEHELVATALAESGLPLDSFTLVRRQR